MSTTDISLLEQDNSNETEQNDDKKLYGINTQDLKNYSAEELLEPFFDGTLSDTYRCEVLKELYNKDQGLASDALNKLTSMFLFTPISLLKDFLTQIVMTDDIPFIFKNECSLAIIDFDKPLGYKCMNEVCKCMKNVSIPLQVEVFKYLFETREYMDETREYFNKLILNPRIECEYRYKILLSIQKSNRPYHIEYLDTAYYQMATTDDIFTRFRILCSQYLLQKIRKEKKEGKLSSENKKIRKEIEKICIGFAQDTELDYNLRADAADLLVTIGTKSSMVIGKNIISFLGEDFKGVKTIYTNNQNVHSKMISESVDNYIKILSTIPLKTKNGKFLEFSDVQEEIEIEIREIDNFNEVLKKIRSSLLRISLDQFLYNNSQTLQGIFIKVWQIICSHEYSNDLKNRMIEELIDMADTCTSGHTSRIVNVLSGFEINGETIRLNIGWQDQIKSNLIGRLNKLVKDMEDLDIQEKILEEMATKGDMIEKPNLLNFFRTNLFPIKDELYNEFVDKGKHISQEEFDIYIRNAISYFEEGI